MENVRVLISKTSIQILLLVFLSLIPYSGIFNNQFVVDDASFIVNWGQIRSLSSWPELIKGSLPQDRAGVYRPVRSILYGVYFHAFGTTPFGYHLHGITIQILGALLVFLILKIIFLDGKAAFLASALFAVHPAHVETITYISASMEATGLILALLAFWLVIKSQKNQLPTKFSTLSLIFAVIAVLTYEMTLTLPLLIVFYEYFRFKFNLKKLLANFRVLLFYAIPIPVYFVVRMLMSQASISRGEYLAESFAHTILIMPKIFVWYIWLLFVPLKLSVVHTIAPGFETYMNPLTKFDSILSKSLFDLDILGSILILVTLIALSLIWRKKFPLFLFAVGWFFITLLPVSYIIPVGPVLSEKYLYLPSFGFVLLAAYVLVVVPVRRKLIRRVYLIGLIGLIFFYGVRTFVRNFDWQDTESLNLSVLREYPQSVIAKYTLGSYYADINNNAGAEKIYRQLLAQEPDFAIAHHNLANALERQYKLEEASFEFAKALEYEPNFLESYIGLAEIAQFENKYDFALEKLYQSLTIDQTSALSIKGRFSDTLDFRLRYDRVYQLMGEIYGAQNKAKMAVQGYAMASYFGEKPEYLQSVGEVIKKNPALINSVLPPLVAGGENLYFSSQGLFFKYPHGWRISRLGNNIEVVDSRNRTQIKIGPEGFVGFTKDSDLILESIKTFK